jgi:hypothetical protein
MGMGVGGKTTYCRIQWVLFAPCEGILSVLLRNECSLLVLDIALLYRIRRVQLINLKVTLVSIFRMKISKLGEHFLEEMIFDSGLKFY